MCMLHCCPCLSSCELCYIQIGGNMFSLMLLMLFHQSDLQKKNTENGINWDTKVFLLILKNFNLFWFWFWIFYCFTPKHSVKSCFCSLFKFESGNKQIPSCCSPPLCHSQVIARATVYKRLLVTIKAGYDDIIGALQRREDEARTAERSLAAWTSHSQSLMTCERRAAQLRERCQLLLTSAEETWGYFCICISSWIFHVMEKDVNSSLRGFEVRECFICDRAGMYLYSLWLCRKLLL